jgi:hypothetical protein
LKDAQALLELLRDQCYSKDPVAFMDKVRADCGNLLNVADKEAKVNPKSVPTWKATHKQLFEEDARQLQAWESCGKRSRKGKKREDLGDFLMTVKDYMDARADVAKAARDIAQAAK